jgi:hypothetical protein
VQTKETKGPSRDLQKAITDKVLSWGSQSLRKERHGFNTLSS